MAAPRSISRVSWMTCGALAKMLSGSPTLCTRCAATLPGTSACTSGAFSADDTSRLCTTGSGSYSTSIKSSASSAMRSEEHTSELQSRQYLVCRLLLEKKKNKKKASTKKTDRDLT